MRPALQNYARALKFSLYIIVNPFKGFWDMKREKKGSLSAALGVLRNMVKPVLWDVGGLSARGMGRKEFLVAGLGFLVLLGVDARSLKVDPAREVAEAPRWLRWGVYLALLLSAVVFGSYGTGYDAQSFIYGQF